MRTMEAHHVIPARYRRQAVLNLVVVAAEMDGDGAVDPLFRGDVVERASVEGLLLEVAFCVVEADDQKASTGTSLTVSRWTVAVVSCSGLCSDRGHLSADCRRKRMLSRSSVEWDRPERACVKVAKSCRGASPRVRFRHAELLIENLGLGQEPVGFFYFAV
jgi:hypothetical protein